MCCWTSDFLCVRGSWCLHLQGQDNLKFCIVHFCREVTVWCIWRVKKLKSTPLDPEGEDSYYDPSKYWELPTQ